MAKQETQKTRRHFEPAFYLQVGQDGSTPKHQPESGLQRYEPVTPRSKPLSDTIG